MRSSFWSVIVLTGAYALAACGGVGPPPAKAPIARPPQREGVPAKWRTPFVASSNRPFDAQMMETMERMDDGMAKAPMIGTPDRDFVTMMIPHHQGGIDMAKVLLVHGQDPEMRRLAQAIITDQQNEIQLMQLWLERHPDSLSSHPVPPTVSSALTEGSP